MQFRGRKGDRAQVGSVIVRTRSEVRGPCSELGEGGGAFALMAALAVPTARGVRSALAEDRKCFDACG